MTGEYNMSDFFRIASAVPEMQVADPVFNGEKIISLYDKALSENAALVVFPELSVTGSSCGDLFEQKLLLNAAEKVLKELARATLNKPAILAVGLPLLCKNRLYNTVAVCAEGKVLGFAVKKYLSNHRNNFEGRYFSSADTLIDNFVMFDGEMIPLASDIIFETPSFSFGIDFGSNFGTMTSQSADLAAAGAQIILIPAALPETANAAVERKNMIKSESSRTLSACIFSGAGVHESSGEQLCAGHALIACDGRLIAENDRFDHTSNITFADINPEWINLTRRSWSNFNAVPSPGAVYVSIDTQAVPSDLTYAKLEKNPFVPENPQEAAATCREIFAIQANALAKRFTSCGAKRMVLGLSGGLDSTLALLVAAKCCDILNLPRNTICAVTMPGFGTSSRTKGNAEIIAEKTGAELRTIPINDAVEQHFKDIGHDPENRNVVYENSQARERTQILMDIANAVNGIVIGTGDLSEIALGWSTFNGDHMSMYCVNCDVPKTLMRSMVEFAASESDEALAASLRDICNTPVSPELLPGAQHTENIIGSYELHDFFLYYLIRYGETPEMLAFLAKKVFAGIFDDEEIDRTCAIFIRRFVTQQFKRNASPEGPRTNTVSLGAKSDWRMPSDSSLKLWQ